ncbi:MULTISPECIES: PLP-dependent aminotransferase family protein [Brevibacterium]|uniref:Transcriptional regulator, GntR family n=1 Tax=Brevibacterium antiquum CNRZ 918 TaxID=1255637 RepID=A0A2H1HU09_9MICO|nr:MULTISPECIES: PLP-dependent aminotransferase family protein [Brevibacterium]SMX66336.1 transcriptional regulator, GntR family [Brevibacterium antiquum CNRZ 918]
MSTAVMSGPRLADIIGTGPWPGPAYDSLTAGISRAIGDGRIPVGARLPSEREAAAATGLSRTTTSRAFAKLREQGFVVTRRGSGSVVQLPEVPGGRIDHLLTPAGADEAEIDLTCTASVAPPWLLGAYERAVAQIHAYLPGTGYYPSGLPVLKELIAESYTARGVRTAPDQILITSGAFGAVSIAVRALNEGRGRVLIESPTYPNAIATLEGAGASLIPYPLELSSAGHHWDIDAMDHIARQTRVRSAYLIPDFHNPTGALLPEEQRPELGAMLKRNSMVPIFDESLVELGLDGDPTPTPMAAFVPDSITAGSTSKIFWGGLRVGWMRIPTHRIEAMASTRLSLDLGAPVLEQLVAVELMRDHDTIVGEYRVKLRAARDSLAAQVRAHLPSWQVIVPSGGMALWCRLPEDRSGALAVAARRHGLGLVSGPNFAPAGGLDRWIRLPYTVSETQLGEVGPRLAAAWDDALKFTDRVPAGRARIVA